MTFEEAAISYLVGGTLAAFIFIEATGIASVSGSASILSVLFR